MARSEPTFLMVAPDTDRLRDRQLAALNAALSAEVLRHAETLRRLRVALTWVLFKPSLEPIEAGCRVPSAAGPPQKPASRGHWVPGQVRPPVRFPVALGARTGLAAFIAKPLLLRSGAILDPVKIAARRGPISTALPDSSWLVLAALARRPGQFFSSAELQAEVFSGPARAALRSAIYRARATLATVEAAADLESAPDRKAGWRLLLAHE